MNLSIAHHAATTELCESWSVENPNGSQIHFGSYADAVMAATTGIF